MEQVGKCSRPDPWNVSMDESLIISFGSKFPGSYDSWIERVCISIDVCWYLEKNIWITVSSSGASDNEMLWQRNIQEVIFYFVQKDKLVL